MKTLTLRGPKAGTAVNFEQATVGTDTAIGRAIASWLLPARLNQYAVIVGTQRAGETVAIEVEGLSAPTAYDWQDSDGVSLGVATATLDLTGRAMQRVQCAVTTPEGVFVTPSVYVYMTMNASHAIDDNALLALLPHNEATHVAIIDGDWTDPATWFGGVVPAAGACVLIPVGVTVGYDVPAPCARFDRVRVDGALVWSLTTSTQMLVETLIGTVGSKVEIGTAANRVPSAISHDIVFSDRDYQTDSRGPTNIDFNRDPRLLSRGFISNGEITIWGEEKDSWLYTADGNAPMATDNTLAMSKAPNGWAVGDRIVVAGTALEVDLGSQSEERVITGINGLIVTLDAPLVWDHHVAHSQVNRPDLQPAILNLTHNVEMRSENPAGPAWQRAHTMFMHHMAKVDVWSCSFRDLGRTKKGPLDPAGVIDAGLFKIVTQDVNNRFVTSPLDATSNLQSRYAVHLHFLGSGKDFVDRIVDCSVSHSGGWACVHHGCEAIMDNNAIYDFGGSGMVGESGNETGSWDQNAVCYSRQKTLQTLKNIETEGSLGDRGAYGNAFYQFGRAIRSNQNFASDVSVGFAFFHRDNANTIGSIAPAIALLRAEVDMGDIQGIEAVGDIAHHAMPIIHFAQNRAAGCVFGLNVVKSTGKQNHGLNIRLSNMIAWNFVDSGAWIEYIGQYLLEDFDMVGNEAYPLAHGVSVEGNSYEVTVANAKTERCGRGIWLENFLDARNLNQFYDPVSNPRWTFVGHNSINDTIPILIKDDTTEQPQIIANYPAVVDPSHDLPFILADYGATEFLNAVTGTLTDTLGNGPLPKPDEPLGMPLAGTRFDNNRGGTVDTIDRDGYWDFDDGTGIVPIVLFPLYVADRITGEFIKTIHAIRITHAPLLTGRTNNGVFTLASGAPVVPEQNVSVVAGQSVTLNPPALVTNDFGETITLGSNYYGADFGSVDLDTSTGDVTYTPRRGYVGPDRIRPQVENGAGHVTVVDVNINVTAS